jgi:hypothetical protein
VLFKKVVLTFGSSISRPALKLHALTVLDSKLSQFRRHTALRSTVDSRLLDEIAPSRIPKAVLDERRFAKELLDHRGAYH